MKNKKGFTIVELLVVIAIMALLIVIAVPTGLTISKKVKKSMLDSKIEQLESASVVWGQNNEDKIKEASNSCTINTSSPYCIRKTIKDMLNTENAFAEDYKDENGVKHLKNPTNDESMNGCHVEIYIKENKRVYAKYDNTEANCYYTEDKEESENENNEEDKEESDENITYTIEYSGPNRFLIGEIDASYFKDYITCKDSNGKDCDFVYYINGWNSESGDYTSENYKLNAEGDIDLFIATKATNIDGGPMADVNIPITMDCAIDYLRFQYTGPDTFEDGTIDTNNFSVDCKGTYNGETISCNEYSNGWFYRIDSEYGTTIWESTNSHQTINIDYGYYDVYYEIPANNCGTTKYATIERAIYIELYESPCDSLIAENYSASREYNACESTYGVHNCYSELSAWDDAFYACQEAGCGC